MFKKIVAVVLVIALTAAASIAGTMAYLQDDDSDVNVMTLGNVYIEQIEQERDAKGDLVDFTQAKPAYPAVYEGDSIPYADPSKYPVAGDEAWKVVEDNANVIDKFVTVKNTGKSDAYVRTVVAFEVGKDAVNDPYMHLVCNGDKAGWTYEWVKENGEEIVIEVEGNYYKVVVFTHKTPLAPGAVTAPSVKQVYLDKTATNEVCEAYGETFDILVLSQAVQTAGFTSAAEALEAAFPGIDDADTIAAWFRGAEFKAPTVVSTAEELADALSAGKSVVLTNDIVVTETLNIEDPTNINLNGHNLTVSVLEAKDDTNISNGTLTHGKSTYPAISVSKGTLKMDNVNIVCEEYCSLNTGNSGAEAAEYAAINVWSGNLVLDNCTITVSTDKIRYSNSVFGIGIHGGEVTMNGGSITIDSHGSTKPQYDYQAVIFAGSAPDKTVNLNNVKITMDDGAKYLYAWGGKTILNTTDAVTEADVDARYGGTYEIN